MALLQRAIETYESHFGYTQRQDGMTPMAPVGHSIVKADLEITLDPDGRFVIASAVSKDEQKTLIPVTEASAGRTSSPCPHPLCELLKYLLPQNEEKFKLYTERLAAWEASEYSHPKLRPILNYVKSGSIAADLLKCGLIKTEQTGYPANDGLMIRWRVQGGTPEECWLDSALFEAHARYTLSVAEHRIGLCMVTGSETDIASQHIKGVFPQHGNAKLISANDPYGFTYLGRFTEDRQAAEVGYEASQKAHNALRWLIDEKATVLGGRALLCWNPQGKTVTPVTVGFRPAKPKWLPDAYHKDLRDTLLSRKREFEITDGVVIAAFDAATTGRLALTYYNEFQAHDFLERLHYWNDTCCWLHWRYGIQSPGLAKIVNCAFGTLRTEKGKARMIADDKLLSQELQRLIACRVERAAMGADIVKALVNHASEPQCYDRDVWEDILFTACAVIRKYRYDIFKEEWNMALEPEKKDRSYQFGRLLAVMEKVERDTYDDSDGREPNAIRMQSVFCRRPMYAAGIIEKQLEQAYFPRLKPGSRSWYKSLIAQIMEVISQYPQESWNAPLEDCYLMGYYLQRKELYTSHNKDTEENDNE